MDNGDVHSPLPHSLHLSMNVIHASPGAMRTLTAVTGRTMDQMFNSDEPADKFQAIAFFELLRMNTGKAPAELWEHAGGMDLEMGPDAAPDPFGTASSTPALLSADSGGSIPTTSTT